MYIIPVSIDTKQIYDPYSHRTMHLKRNVKVYKVNGSHGDYCYGIKEFDIYGGYTWDEAEAQRSLIVHLFEIYEHIHTYSGDNFKHFRELIEKVDRWVIC